MAEKISAIAVDNGNGKDGKENGRISGNTGKE